MLNPRSSLLLNSIYTIHLRSMSIFETKGNFMRWASCRINPDEFLQSKNITSRNVSWRSCSISWLNKGGCFGGKRRMVSQIDSNKSNSRNLKDLIAEVCRVQVNSDASYLNPYTNTTRPNPFLCCPNPLNVIPSSSSSPCPLSIVPLTPNLAEHYQTISGFGRTHQVAQNPFLLCF